MFTSNHLKLILWRSTIQLQKGMTTIPIWCGKWSLWYIVCFCSCNWQENLNIYKYLFILKIRRIKPKLLMSSCIGDTVAEPEAMLSLCSCFLCLSQVLAWMSPCLLWFRSCFLHDLAQATWEGPSVIPCSGSFRIWLSVEIDGLLLMYFVLKIYL